MKVLSGQIGIPLTSLRYACNHRGPRDHLADLVLGVSRGPRPWLLLYVGQPLAIEALEPGPDGGLAQAQFLCDGWPLPALVRQSDDARPFECASRCGPGACQLLGGCRFFGRHWAKS